MQTSLQAIANKAMKHKQYRFQNLYGMLDFTGLTDAWTDIKKKAAPGVDRVTAVEFAKDFEKNIQAIVAELKEKRYKAKLVRRTYIPKGPGKVRPLGIPVIADKIVQRRAADILGIIYEQDFLPNSYGYRPKVGPQEAVRKLTEELQFGKYSYIVEADIKGCFENINHEWLIRMVEQRVDDKAYRRTSRKKLRKSLANFTDWSKKNRNKRLLPLFQELNSKLRGYYNYYGVIGNMESLDEFYNHAMKILYRWLNRRSQRRSFTWVEFKRVLKRYKVLLPRITEKSYQLSLGFEV